MRLHRLAVTAFGPFADRVDLDLDRVADQGLFLIRGATGAGKTSLLDAIAFALFADVPGARSKKGLHSDHAAPGAVPRAVLEFTASGRRLRIERSPEFRRPKARGAGETTVPASVALTELEGDQWRPLSTRHDEVAEVIQDVLGLGMQQFSKVVLLPQGDFSVFLRASPEERRELLERLFDVSSFVSLEDWFAQRRKESAAVVEEGLAGLAADRGILAEVLAGVPNELLTDCPDWAGLSPEALAPALTRVAQSLGSAAITSIAALDAARSADELASLARTDARRVVDLRARGTSARDRHTALVGVQADHDAQVATLEAALRAAALEGDLRALARSATALEEAKHALAGAQRAASQLALSDGDVDQLTGARVGLVDGGRVLDSAGARRAAITERARRVDEVAQRLATVRSRVEAHTAAHETVAQREVRLAERLAAAAAAVAALPVAARAVEDLVRVRRLRTEQDRSALQSAEVAAQVARATTISQDLRDAYLDLRQARLEGMAAELAAGLDDGAPCPVCGAHEHPQPAATSSPVTAETVDAAEQEWRRADAALAHLRREQASLEAAMAERSIHLGADPRSAVELDAALAAARADHESVAGLASTQGALREQVDSAGAAREACALELARLNEAQTEDAGVLRSLQSDLAAEREGLVEVMAAHDGCPCTARESSPADDTAGLDQDSEVGRLEALRARHDAALALVEALIEAVEREAAAAAAHEAVAVEVGVRVRESGFSGVEAARAATLGSAAMAALQESTDDWRRCVDAALSTLEDPEVAAALDGPAPDLEQVSALCDRARAHLLKTSADDAVLRRTLDGLARVRTTIDAHCAALAVSLEEHRVIRELADTLGGTGSNTMRMRLSAFVLAARLEKVVVLANERLSVMGDGRYRLRHTDGLAARGARSGLGLEVLDLWTGQPRDTASLSGGESFMASLALALGLADAVREEAGGFDLQTLFIDEGFGTLDDDSLEQVMEVLDGLREGGRAVGVVSHVAELRSRIPSQVVVSKSEHGSAVEVAGADSAAPAA